MKVEVDFEEALQAFVQEKKASEYNRPSSTEIATFISKLLETLPDYQKTVSALVEVLQGEAEYVRDEVIERFAEKAES